jgi:hypothetical protein
LIIITNEIKLRPFEETIINRSTKIRSFGIYSVYQFSPTNFEDKNAFLAKKEKLTSGQLNKKLGWSMSDTSAYIYYDDFSNQKSNYSVSPLGAYGNIKKQWNIIKKFDAAQIPTGQYKVSFWYYLGVGKPAVLSIIEQEFTESTSWEDKFEISRSNHTVNNWSLVELNVNITKETKSFNLLFTCGANHKPFIIDDLLMRPANVDLIRKTTFEGQTYLNVNNYMLNWNSFSE